MPQKTILITGASSGFGKATAQFFLDRGWNVVATMRKPDPAIFAASSGQLQVLPLDVTNADSIRAALDEAIKTFGTIDVLVNNAGIGLFGAFEATPMSTTREVFETNTFGVMAVTQAVVPLFRERNAGTIVNVTSSVTLAPIPMLAVYTGSKSAIEGFTGSLALELSAFNIKVKLVEPGYAPGTSFTSNTATRLQELIPETYQSVAAPLLEAFAEPAAFTTEADVAEVIWQAVTENTDQLRYPAGADAVALSQAR
ncbi:MAG: SDR family oxidoreductase [Bryobacterales bacterium]|nr:SDR family oxidoreductase [Bryobacterales bacterium]